MMFLLHLKRLGRQQDSCWECFNSCWITEVNIKLACKRIFKQPEATMMEFCQSFAHKLIYNDYLEEENVKRKKRQRKKGSNIHELVSLPLHKNFDRTQIAPSKTWSLQWRCYCKAKWVNSYCKCTPGVLLCKSCFATHVSDSVVSN